MDNKSFRNLTEAAANVIAGNNKKNLKDHVELSELSRKKLIDIINTTGAELAGDLHTDEGKVTPRTNKLARVKAKAKKKLDRLRIDPEKFGTGHVYKPDTIQGKWVDAQDKEKKK